MKLSIHMEDHLKFLFVSTDGIYQLPFDLNPSIMKQGGMAGYFIQRQIDDFNNFILQDELFEGEELREDTESVRDEDVNRGNGQMEESFADP